MRRIQLFRSDAILIIMRAHIRSSNYALIHVCAQKPVMKPVLFIGLSITLDKGYRMLKRNSTGFVQRVFSPPTAGRGGFKKDPSARRVQCWLCFVVSLLCLMTRCFCQFLRICHHLNNSFFSNLMKCFLCLLKYYYSCFFNVCCALFHFRSIWC